VAPPRPAGRAALIGRTIGGKYEVQKLLGKGAMGEVYSARHAALDRIVAVKIVTVDERTDRTLIGRFKSEARAASRLDHPNSVQIIDYGEENEGRLLYIVMELLKGQDLEVVLKRIGRMSETRACAIMSQVLSALTAAHQNSIVHRDLKPANIMLVKNLSEGSEVVKVCDFGIAKLQDPLSSEDPTGMMTMTKAGAVIGTPSYMSPEQAAGKRVDARTDLFSCGVILYRMLTGKKPFTSETLMGLLSQVMSHQPTPISQLNAAVDGRLVQIVERAMQKDPNQRFQSAREMKQALDDVLSSPDRTVHQSAGLGDTRPVVRTPTPRANVPPAGSVISGSSNDPAEAPRNMSSATAWTGTGTYIVSPPATSSKIPLVLGALLLVGGIAYGVTQLKSETADVGQLSTLVDTGNWGAAENYALDHFEHFRSDPVAVGYVLDSMRQRRASAAFPEDFPIGFDASYELTPGRWRGSLGYEGRDEHHAFVMDLREVQDHVVTGVVEWPEVGLTAKILGYYDGNHLLMWDYEVSGSERFMETFTLYDKKSVLFAKDGSMRGYDGVHQQDMTAQRLE
jgi:serine/threonine protein kinase